MTLLEDIKAKRKFAILNRVSTSTQLKSLPLQVTENESRLTQMGVPAKDITSVSQQESGKKKQRQTLDDVIEIVEKGKKGEYTVVVRDIARLGRNVDVIRETVRELNAMGANVHVLDSNLHLTGDPDDYNSLMVLTLLAAVAEGGKGAEGAAARTGTKFAKKKGIFSGGIKEAYTSKVKKTGKRKGKSIFRIIYEDIPSFNNGTSTNKGLSRELDMSPTMTRVIRKQLLEIEERGGPEKIEEYLRFWDAMVAAEMTRGVGQRTRPMKDGGMTNRANALHRVTIAYIQDPFGWPDPVTKGNPDTKMPFAPDTATGTIQDALDNYTFYYKPSK